MKLQYGRHKGQDILDVPVDYLRWMEGNVELTPQQRKDINFEIGRRTGDRPGEGRTVPQEEIERKKHSR